LTFYDLNRTDEAVSPNIFQNGSNSPREATPPEELEPVLEEPEPCQTEKKRKSEKKRNKNVGKGNFDFLQSQSNR
jgi:hypothetical protein